LFRSGGGSSLLRLLPGRRAPAPDSPASPRVPGPASRSDSMGFQHDLEQALGLKNVQYKANLSKEDLFQEALRNDRGRIRPNGPDDEPKAWATKLGVKGPLVYYSDPSCTGRPVQDTFGVAWPELESEVWWK